MHRKAGIATFLALSLALMAAAPLVNLRDDNVRTYARRLLAERNYPRLQRLLFNADFLVAEFSALTWRTGLSTSPAKVVVGQDGWLFLGDAYGDNVSQHRFGEQPGDPALAARIATNLLAWQAWLRAQGVQGFALVIGSDKHHIYREALPHWADLGRPPRIRSLLDGPARALIADPAPALRQASAQGPVPTYYRSDTHWNLYGAALSLDALRQTLAGQGVALRWPTASPPAIEHVGSRIGGDLGRFLYIQERLEEPEPHPAVTNREAIDGSDIRVLETGERLEPGAFGQLQFPRHTVRVVTPGALNPLKVLWLRDSFGIAQSPLMAAAFRETIQLHWGTGFENGAQRLVELVRQQRPDLVVLTVVERGLLSDVFLTPPPQD